MKRILITLIILVVFLSAGRSVSHAQTPALELSVTPPTGYIKLKPGGEGTHTVTLSNTGDTSVTVEPKLVDFSSDGTTGIPILSDSLTFPYLDSDPQSFQPLTIPPKGKAQLTLHFTVPQGAGNKEYPLTLLFTTMDQTKSPSLGVGASVNASVGANVIVLVTGADNPDPEFSFQSLQVNKFGDSFRPIQFKPKLENKGFSASVASGSAQLTNWQGKVLKTFPLRPTVVLGSSTRELEADNSSGFYYKQPFLFGVYHLTVTLTSIADPQKVLVTTTENVIILPFLLIGSAIFLTCILFYYKYWQKKHHSLL